MKLKKIRNDFNSPLKGVRDRAQAKLDRFSAMPAEQKTNAVADVFEQLKAYDPNATGTIDIEATAKAAVDQAKQQGAEYDAFVKGLFEDAQDSVTAIRNSLAKTTQDTGTTVEQVRTALTNRFGEKTTAKLEKDGVLSIVDSYSVPGVEGYSQGGKFTLVANTLTPDSVVAVFLIS